MNAAMGDPATKRVSTRRSLPSDDAMLACGVKDLLHEGCTVVVCHAKDLRRDLSQPHGMLFGKGPHFAGNKAHVLYSA